MAQGTEQPPQPTREERLAEQLRANLRRRKTQARALVAPDTPPALDSSAGPDPLAPEEPPR